MFNKSIAIYDIETVVNRTIVGFLIDGEYRIFQIGNKPTSQQSAELEEIASSHTLIGFNNKGFDTFILRGLIDGKGSEVLYRLGQDIITGDEPAWQIAKKNNFYRLQAVEFDLMFYLPQGGLKKFEARMGRDIKNMPFDHAKRMSKKVAEGEALEYLKEDLDATLALFETDFVQGELQMRQTLESEFGVTGLLGLKSSRVAERCVAALYAQALDGEDDDNDVDEILRALKNNNVKQLHRSYSFEVEVPKFARDVCREAGLDWLVDTIDGTGVAYDKGWRTVDNGHWPRLVELTPCVDVSFGLGGIHSNDPACRMSGFGCDATSYYPHLLLHDECIPEQLDKPIFKKIWMRLIEHRLEKKRSGDKQGANAVKLVLNSFFGIGGDKWSAFFWPPSFLNITISGQLCLMALGKRLGALEGVEVVSLNTDGVYYTVAENASQEDLEGVCRAWEKAVGVPLETVRIEDHRQTNINSYIQIEDGAVKSKGQLICQPGLTKDPAESVVPSAIAALMKEGTQLEATIGEVHLSGDPLPFVRVSDAASGYFRYQGEDLGRTFRFYRAEGALGEGEGGVEKIFTSGKKQGDTNSVLQGYRPLVGSDMPADVDVAAYVAKAKEILDQTDTVFCPRQHLTAKRLIGAGYKVRGRTLRGAPANMAKECENYAGSAVVEVCIGGRAELAYAPGDTMPESSVQLRLVDAEGRLVGCVGDRRWLGDNPSRQKSTATKVGARITGWVEISRANNDLAVCAAGQGPVWGGEVLPTPGPGPGGEAPSPSLAPLPDASRLTNDAYLEAVYGTYADDAFIHSTNVPVSNWLGTNRQRCKTYQRPEFGNYTCVSVFSGPTGRRRNEDFNALVCVMLDDVGTKAPDPTKHGFPAPTMKLETSPGNFQFVYKLDVPLTQFGVAQQLVDIVTSPVMLAGEKVLFTDTGAKGVNRIYRLPVGSNLKKKLKAPFLNVVHAFDPGRRFSADAIASWFGQALDWGCADPRTGNGCAGLPSDEVAAHPLAVALAAEEMILGSRVKPEGWLDIKCPWGHEHSDGDLTGTAVRFKENGSWAFHCHHGTCTDSGRKARDVHHYLTNLGHDVPAPHVTNVLDKFDTSGLEFDEQVNRGETDIISTFGEGSEPGRELTPEKRALIDEIWPTRHWDPDNIDALLRANTWLVDEFIPQGITTIAGNRGVGKTVAIAALVMVVAGLIEFDKGRIRCSLPRKVMWLCEDLEQVEAIFFGLITHYGIDPRRLWDRVKLRSVNRKPIKDVVWLAKVTRDLWITHESPSGNAIPTSPLTINDTQSAMIEMDDESSSSEGSNVLARLREAWEGEECRDIWNITHTPKSNHSDPKAMSARGTGAFEANVRSVYYVFFDEGLGLRSFYGGDGAKRRDFGSIKEIVFDGDIHEAQRLDVMEQIQTVRYLVPQLEVMTPDERERRIADAKERQSEANRAKKDGEKAAAAQKRATSWLIALEPFLEETRHTVKKPGCELPCRGYIGRGCKDGAALSQGVFRSRGSR